MNRKQRRHKAKLERKSAEKYTKHENNLKEALSFIFSQQNYDAAVEAYKDSLVYGEPSKGHPAVRRPSS